MEFVLICSKILALVITLNLVFNIFNALYITFALSLSVEMLGTSLMSITIPYILVFGIVALYLLHKSVRFLATREQLLFLWGYIFAIIIFNLPLFDPYYIGSLLFNNIIDINEKLN